MASNWMQIMKKKHQVVVVAAEIVVRNKKMKIIFSTHYLLFIKKNCSYKVYIRDKLLISFK